jgi:hypothetical protein
VYGPSTGDFLRQPRENEIRVIERDGWLVDLILDAPTSPDSIPNSYLNPHGEQREVVTGAPLARPAKFRLAPQFSGRTLPAPTSDALRRRPD